MPQFPQRNLKAFTHKSPAVTEKLYKTEDNENRNSPKKSQNTTLK